nr:helix-turn-helix domain-containing protein [Pseudonocardia acaciae]
MFTPTEVAAFLRVSKMTIYRMVDHGDIGGVRVGRSLRIPRTALETLIGQRLTPDDLAEIRTTDASDDESHDDDPPSPSEGTSEPASTPERRRHDATPARSSACTRSGKQRQRPGRAASR